MLSLTTSQSYSIAVIQPVVCVRTHLATRPPVLDCLDEERLLITLPECHDNPLRSETRALCRACMMVLNRVNDGLKVQPACKEVLAVFAEVNRFWKLKTFRAKYDLWILKRDWVVLVNRSKAGAGWVDRDFSLSDKFLDYCAARVGDFKRSDAQAEALRSLRRQWQTGLTHLGESEPVPGYEWQKRNPLIIPEGWSVGNLRRQLKQRAKITAAEKALLHDGIAAARHFLPQVRSTREGLRFLEEIQFDDVKCDFRVFDTATGKPVDLWLLIAHDRATAMLLGFGMRPATVREDGSQEHLQLQDMKQLAGWVLERYGLPPYLSTWKVENGTATFSDGSAAAMEEMLPGRLKISFAMMVGGKSPSGYLERALGNSMAKASLESHNRIGHMIAAGLPGQTGPHYGVRQKGLAAMERECETIYKAAEHLPSALRERLVNEFGYPLLTLQQARRALFNIFSIRNARTDHNLEDFEQVLEKVGGNVRQRMESPAERANRLREGMQFTPVSPEIISAFYEHTERVRPVEENGHISFSHERKELEFMPPAENYKLPVGTKCLCYFHPDDPRFLHLTDGSGKVLGTWLRKALVKSNQRDAVSDAIRYSTHALNLAKARAADLAGGDRLRLDAMREHNEQLLAANTFTDVTPHELGGNRDAATSNVATSLVANAQSLREAKKAEAKRESNLKAFKGDISDLAEPTELSQPTHTSEPADDFSAEGLL